MTTLSSNIEGRPFIKMNGCGNSIVVLDLRGDAAPVATADVRAIAANETLTFDQLMVVRDARAAGTAAFMEIFNRDGSTAHACGNGTRCVAWALTRASGASSVRLETHAGILTCERREPTQFRVDMGAPRLKWDEIPLRDPFADTRTIELQIGPIDAPVLHTPSAVSMGNPHAIFWVDDVGAYDLARFGPLLENHPIFPDRANISLAEVRAPDHLVVRVWERGAGLTLACGTAACAAVVAAVRRGFCHRKVRVTLPGGDLAIEWRESDSHVLLTGAVAFEHEGRLGPELFREAIA